MGVHQTPSGAFKIAELLGVDDGIAAGNESSPAGGIMATLRIDWEKVNLAREAARQIAEDVHAYTQEFTTTTIERSICRLFGVDGVDAMGVPLPNVIVDHIASRQLLGFGAAYWLGQATISHGKEPQELAEAVAQGELDLTQTEPVDLFEIQLWAEKKAEEALAKIHHNRIIREEKLSNLGPFRTVDLRHCCHRKHL